MGEWQAGTIRMERHRFSRHTGRQTFTADHLYGRCDRCGLVYLSVPRLRERTDTLGVPR